MDRGAGPPTPIYRCQGPPDPERRLAGLGATITGVLSDDESQYAVGMKDPEGNEFDIN